jgi:hypothetical protein
VSECCGVWLELGSTPGRTRDLSGRNGSWEVHTAAACDFCRLAAHFDILPKPAAALLPLAGQFLAVASLARNLPFPCSWRKQGRSLSGVLIRFDTERPSGGSAFARR